MKHPDTNTLLMPFMEVITTAAGINKVQLKSEITVAEACRVLNCSRNTIYAMVDDGSLPARRLRDVPKSKMLVCGQTVAARRLL